MKARAEQENTVSTLLDDLKNLVVDDALKRQLHEVANGLGLPQVESSFKELEVRAEEVRSIAGRQKALLWQCSLVQVGGSAEYSWQPH